MGYKWTCILVSFCSVEVIKFIRRENNRTKAGRCHWSIYQKTASNYIHWKSNYYRATSDDSEYLWPSELIPERWLKAHCYGLINVAGRSFMVLLPIVQLICHRGQFSSDTTFAAQYKLNCAVVFRDPF